MSTPRPWICDASEIDIRTFLTDARKEFQSMPHPTGFDTLAGLRNQLRASELVLQGHGQQEPLSTFKDT